MAHTGSMIVSTTRASAFPATTTLHSKTATTTFSLTVETGVPSSSESSDVTTSTLLHITTSTLPHITTSTLSHVTSSSTSYTSTRAITTNPTTTVAPETSTKSTTQILTSTTSNSPSPSPTAPGGQWWKPTAGVTWQIQISGTVDTSIAADVYDVDLFDTPASTIATLHSLNRKVICYFSAGSYENWRPDQSSFQASDKGSAMQGWAGEWWLNTNSANVRSIMTSRIEMAVSKGCDGIDPDNVDGYDNANGVGLTESDAVDFLTFLATNAHSRGMAIGLKNAGGLINTVLPTMEWAVNEQCEQYNECNLSDPFIQAGKPVFHIEYPDGAPNISPGVKQASCGGGSSTSGFSTVLKTLDLTAWVDPC